MLADYKQVMKTVADPTRARILKMLQSGELCTAQLVAILKLAQPTVTKHLALLSAAGLLQTRKYYRWVFYRLSTTPPNRYARTALKNLNTWLDDDPTVRADAKAAARIRKRPLSRLYQ